jgi:NAD(P)-dependent dehydrogenase (short-subunit alcohol dehydrogenase family)
MAHLAIVTGGAQGIGHGIAEALLQTGAKVQIILIKN